ncbi:MAG: hypothetical protein JWO38_1552 [Gemmataceae bacterium]|nr:hypothetical protein [Gemmataceae bacterium]
MTAVEWDTCSNPVRMLTAAGGRLSDRKLFLFACGCARRVWELLPDAGRVVVPLVEQAADVGDPEARGAAVREAAAAVAEPSTVWISLGLVQRQLFSLELARSAAALLHALETRGGFSPDDASPLPVYLLHLFNPAASEPNPGQADVLRCVAGNPFRRVRVRRAWRTADVLALAAGVYAEAAFDRLPILADALQDAGCADESLLAHLRADTPHARGCWAVDAVLGKS